MKITKERTLLATILGLFLAYFALPISVFSAPATLTVDYDPPTTFMDGRPLTGLQGFKFYCSETQGGPYTLVHTVNDPTATSASVPNCMTTESGTVYFVMTAFTATDESPYSNEASKTFLDLIPSPPTITDVN